MKIAITGASGNMGSAILKELLSLDFVERVNILGHRVKTTKALLKENKKFKSKINVIMGSLSNVNVCKDLIKDMDIVINLAGVIPPMSDLHPKAAIEVNEHGVISLVKALEETKGIKLIHISTIDVYGHRNEKHPSGRVGDPVISSPFDIYGITKMRGEYTVLESSIEDFVVIRQTAMLYDDILTKNISSAIMFQTPFNSPLEWITDKETGVLFKNMIIKENNGELNRDNFWNKCFSVGGFNENKNTYYESLDIGFKIIGGKTSDFFETNYDSLRNSHGIWLDDSDLLDNLFHYKSITYSEFWDSVRRKHKIFGLGKIVPKKLIKKMAIERLLKEENSPQHWVKSGDEARIIAFFGSKETYENIEKDWNKFDLVCKNTNYEDLKTNPRPFNYYFDINKDDKDITIEDLRNVAEAHGGKLLSTEYDGDIYKKLKWETQDNEVFEAKPFSILRCGHWFNVSYKEYAWDFDKLSKKDKIFSQIWLDSHSEDENYYYYFDEEFNAKIK